MDPVCKSSQAQSLQQLLITAVRALVYVGTVTKVAIILKNANWSCAVTVLLRVKKAIITLETVHVMSQSQEIERRDLMVVQQYTEHSKASLSKQRSTLSLKMIIMKKDLV
jgi:hypothetical protein